MKVIITGDAKEEFDELNRIVGDEISKGVKKSNYHTLLNSIKQKISFLKENPQYGIHISKNKIPKEYLNRHSFEIKVLAELVFKISLVRLFDVCGKIAEKRKHRCMSRQLGDVFDFYMLSLCCRGRVIPDGLKHSII